MSTRARPRPDRGGRATALLALRRRGRELGPPRARPARGFWARRTFFTVDVGTFENYLPDEATLAAVATPCLVVVGDSVPRSW
jgi:hypothetical protein